MSLRGVRFSFLATASVSPISYLVDSQQSHHWTSEVGHQLKSLLNLAHGFKRKDTYLICGKHDFVQSAVNTGKGVDLFLQILWWF